MGLGFSGSRPPPPPAACNTAILKAMGKAGKVDEALAWLEDTYGAAAADTAAAAGAAAGGERAAAGRPRGSEQGVASVPVGVGLDHSSFMAVLSACSKAGRWESAQSVLREMDRAGIVPETVAFNTVLAGEITRRFDLWVVPGWFCCPRCRFMEGAGGRKGGGGVGGRGTTEV